jgi:predicted esterase
MPLSPLIFARIRTEAPSPRIITLHGCNQSARDVQDYGLAAAPSGCILGLEASKGVFVGHTIAGYSWFVGPLDHPAPVFFGDSLSNIERFLWDEIDRQQADQAELPFLLGVEQGAIMALATAAAVPDLVSGVIAIDGAFPLVPGWDPPLAPLNRLPVLLLDTPLANAGTQALRGEALVETFRSWDADVTYCGTSQTLPAADMTRWLHARPIRTLAKAL